VVVMVVVVAVASGDWARSVGRLVLALSTKVALGPAVVAGRDFVTPLTVMWW
jgi:hypothetical protein